MHRKYVRRKTKRLTPANKVFSKGPDTVNKKPNNFLFNLQSVIGNHAIHGMLDKSSVHRQVNIGATNHHQEKEADALASRVMASSSSPRTNTINNPRPSPYSNTHGETLSIHDQSFFGPRFNQDFSHVRIHSDSRANILASQINAKAFTLGNNIVFGSGYYQPETFSGRKLIAHELAHVVQQQQSPVAVIQRQAISPDSNFSLSNGFGSLNPSGSLSGSGRLTSPSLAGFLGYRSVDGFVYGQSSLTSAQQNQLQEHAQTLQSLLRDHPAGTIEIVGHTDAPGEGGDNLVLGQARADAAKSYLESQGISADIMSTSSQGEGQLRFQTRGRDRRNRRVEIRFRAEPLVTFGLNLDFSLVPSPDRATPSTTPGVPYPWEIPESVLNPPPRRYGPIRPQPQNILILPPSTIPPRPGFLRQLSEWLTGELGRRDIARLAASIAGGLGMDEAKVREELNDALISAGEAGLRRAIRGIIEAIAGSPTSPLPENGPPLRERSIPGTTIIQLPPIPF